jgi:hypothetical protein
MRLEEEMGDVYAAMRFFIDNNPGISGGRVLERAQEKGIRWAAKVARRFAANG